MGEYPSIHLLWNPFKQCISYYDDEHMEYGDMCSFKEFLINPATWLEGIFEKSYLNNKRTD